jgi:hypothetical protein
MGVALINGFTKTANVDAVAKRACALTMNRTPFWVRGDSDSNFAFLP